MPDELVILDKAVLGEVWTSQAAYANLGELCDTFGHRFAGSPGERGAALFVAERLRRYGLEAVTVESFRYTGWVRGPSSIEVLSPWSVPLRALSLPYCPSTTLEADVRWVGEGEAEDYVRAGAAEGALRGTVVMTAAETSGRGRASSHRRDKYMRAVQAGAAGYLYVNQNPGDMPVTGGLPGGGKGPAPIPGLGLTFETGELLRRLLERGAVRLKINVESGFPEVESSNISATLPADPASPVADEVVLVGAHYDSHDIAPGALDNGTGVVVVLETARVLREVARTRPGGGFARGLRFCFFAAEEIGLLGSWEYVRQHGADLDRIRFVLNLDTVGRGLPGAEALVVNGTPELVPYFTRATAAMGYGIEVRDRFSSASDHFPFAMNGVPTAGLSTSQAAAGSGLVGRGWGHTPADTFDKANPRGLQGATMVAARLLLRAAEAPDWPGYRRTTDEVERQLAGAGLLEGLRRSGRWPPPR
ncbi:MAG TPA: M28 family peptidase [Chloroflexota bacterium]|nr:M28 family peptidase [Chloroflexota bacterium]